MEELGVGSPLVHGTQNKGSGGRGTKAASCRGKWSFGSSSRSFPKEQRCSLLGRCLLSAGWMDKFRQDVPGLLDELQILKTSVVMQKKDEFHGSWCSLQCYRISNFISPDGRGGHEVLQVGGAGPSQSIAGTAPVFNPE